MKKKTVLSITYSAMCIALAMVLPLITGNVPRIGNMLCPMHIPVLLCGFLCGPSWGFAVGAASPLLRSLIFSAPPFFPIAVAMAFELAAYGAISGFLYRRLPKSPWSLYASLLCAMATGRVLWGAVRFILAGLTGTEFPFSAFVAGAVTNAIPGIVIQLILIPLAVAVLERAKLVPNDRL